MLQIDQDTAGTLKFDLTLAVADFAKAVEDHRFTVDVPAPTAHSLVEEIVRRHGGQFQIIEPEVDPPSEPEPPPTTEQLRIMDAAEVEATFTVPSILRALIKDRFDLENRIRVLEAKSTITLAQFKAALANRIRGNGA
jgi:hypothetical protein